jgi:hypothetical protein
MSRDCVKGVWRKLNEGSARQKKAPPGRSQAGQVREAKKLRERNDPSIAQSAGAGYPCMMDRPAGALP